MKEKLETKISSYLLIKKVQTGESGLIAKWTCQWASSALFLSHGRCMIKAVPLYRWHGCHGGEEEDLCSPRRERNITPAKVVHQEKLSTKPQGQNE